MSTVDIPIDIRGETLRNLRLDSLPAFGGIYVRDSDHSWWFVPDPLVRVRLALCGIQSPCALPADELVCWKALPTQPTIGGFLHPGLAVYCQAASIPNDWNNIQFRLRGGSSQHGVAMSDFPERAPVTSYQPDRTAELQTPERAPVMAYQPDRTAGVPQFRPDLPDRTAIPQQADRASAPDARNGAGVTAREGRREPGAPGAAAKATAKVTLPEKAAARLRDVLDRLLGKKKPGEESGPVRRAIERFMELLAPHEQEQVLQGLTDGPGPERSAKLVAQQVNKILSASPRAAWWLYTLPTIENGQGVVVIGVATDVLAAMRIKPENIVWFLGSRLAREARNMNVQIRVEQVQRANGNSTNSPRSLGSAPVVAVCESRGCFVSPIEARAEPGMGSAMLVMMPTGTLNWDRGNPYEGQTWTVPDPPSWV